MKSKKAEFITQGAVIAAIYVVLVLIFGYWSFGPIQFRVAEALTVLPYFTPAAIPGLFLGCIIANVMGGAVVWDIVFGSLATLIGAVGTYMIRKLEGFRMSYDLNNSALSTYKSKKYKYFAPLPPILANTLIIPFVLKYAYGNEEMLWFFIITIGISEIIVCGVFGMLLLSVLSKYRNILFW